jgi:hypothetical protein
MRVAASNSSLSGGLNRIYYTPIFIPSTLTFDRISVRTTSNFSGTAVARMGIYNNDPATSKPTTVVLDAGTISMTAINTAYEITINQTLTAGMYWLAFVIQTSATNNSCTSALNPYFQWHVGNNVVNLNQFIGWYEDGMSGALATAGFLVRSNNNVTPVIRTV